MKRATLTSVAIAFAAASSLPHLRVAATSAHSSEASITDFILRVRNAADSGSTAVRDLGEFAFVLDSTSRGPDFSFQFEGRGATRHEEHTTGVNRQVYDCRAGEETELRFASCCAPTQIAIDSDIYSFNFLPPWLHVKNARWEHSPTIRQIYTWFEVSDKERAPGGLVRLDLGGFLRGVITPRDAGLVWLPDCRSLRLKRSNGVTYTLRIRTPNDADHYGTSLSQLRNVSDDGVSSFAWSHFIVERPSILRFQKPTKEALERAIGEWNTVDYAEQPILLTGSRTAEAVRPLWDTLVAFPRCDAADTPKTNAERNKSEQTIVSLCKYIPVLRATQHIETTPMQCDAMANGLTKELRAAHRCIQQTLAAETSGVGIDDPLLQWRATEMQLSSSLASLLYDRGLMLMDGCPTSAEYKYVFCDALADMGTPCVDFIGGNTVGTALSKDPVVRGILHSHWQWECSEAEVEACEALMLGEKPGSEVERVAVEALVRMNRLDKVPADRLAGWFESEVVNADEATRTDALRILSQVPRGQQYLIERYGPEHPPSPTRDAVWRMLVYRAEATVRTMRFDFLSKGDCEKILAWQDLKTVR